MRWWRELGPGLLFAAAAVGVSHLVQSTRAGAGWGLQMVLLVLLANAVKYPAFRFGPQYAAATGRSLLDGYGQLGRWALWLYLGLTLSTMFAVQAAVTLVTAALLTSLTGMSWGVPQVGAGLLVVCATLLLWGQYRQLDRIARWLMVLLAATTVLVAIRSLPRLHEPWQDLFLGPAVWDTPTILFAAALVGWMPSAVDVSIWQSLWTLERGRVQGESVTPKAAARDFHVGYVGTVVLALCFLLMGATVLREGSSALPTPAAAFAGRVVSAYAEVLGGWTTPVVGVAAFATMFSTTLAVADGFPRALAGWWAALRRQAVGSRPYAVAMAVLMGGAATLMLLAPRSLPAAVDIATTLSFLTAPAISALNHAVMFGPTVPSAHRPARWLQAWSWAGIVLQSLFALAWLVVRVVLSPS
jgi:Mn2+/Fe2+ NRAMP family transporter